VAQKDRLDTGWQGLPAAVQECTVIFLVPDLQAPAV